MMMIMRGVLRCLLGFLALWGQKPCGGDEIFDKIISSSRSIQFNSPYSQLFFFSLLPTFSPYFSLLPTLFWAISPFSPFCSSPLLIVQRGKNSFEFWMKMLFQYTDNPETSSNYEMHSCCDSERNSFSENCVVDFMVAESCVKIKTRKDNRPETYFVKRDN